MIKLLPDGGQRKALIDTMHRFNDYGATQKVKSYHEKQLCIFCTKNWKKMHTLFPLSTADCSGDHVKPMKNSHSLLQKT